jgi:hypothetical protein
LKEVEKGYDALVAERAQIEAKVAPMKEKLELYDSFLGLVRETVSIEDLDKIAGTLPDLITEVKKGKYSSNLLRDFVLKNLTGDMLHILRCKVCGAMFPPDKPPTAAGYKCPKCGATGMTEVYQSQANVLNAAFMPKKKMVIIQKVTPIHQSQPPDK